MNARYQGCTGLRRDRNGPERRWCRTDTALPKILGHGEKEGELGEAHDEMEVH